VQISVTVMTALNKANTSRNPVLQNRHNYTQLYIFDTILRILYGM